MMIKVDFIQNRFLKRVLEHTVYFLILIVLIPGFLYFELCVVLPVVAKQWTLSYFLHIFFATYLLFNIVGNLIYGVFTDTSIQGKILKPPNNHNWEFCAVCECLRPPRAWHCDTCNVCILKRDHHCTFFACCVGYYNQRYFILFTMNVFIAMVYAFYYNVIFATQYLKWNHGLIIAKFLFPLVSFAIDFGSESLYVSILVINVIISAFTGFLFFYHLNNVLKGKTVPETRHCTSDFLYDKGWKYNLIEVFGIRWYLTWILPFMHSPLPGNGIEWIVQDKNK